MIGHSSPSKIDRLLIVRLSAMGDVIHTLPAVQALREAFPEAMFGWLIEERWAELLCAPGTPRRGPRSAKRPLVDSVHTVRLAGWRKSLFTMPTIEEIVRTWNDVRAVHYDIAIDLQGAIRSAALARWSGAPVIYGSAQPRELPSSLWYSRQTIPNGNHVIEQSLSVASAVAGRTLAAPPVQFPVSSGAATKIDRRLTDAGIQRFAILSPGAGWGAKRWPSERYGNVARALAAYGIHSIVNYGPGEEDLARQVEDASGGYARSVSCSITELIALTRRASLFVGGDSGPLHLAAALKIPVVAIFGPTSPERNGPYGTQSIVLRNPASQTTHARNPRPDEGMLEIGVDAVVDAARKMIDQKATEAAHG